MFCNVHIDTIYLIVSSLVSKDVASEFYRDIEVEKTSYEQT